MTVVEDLTMIVDYRRGVATECHSYKCLQHIPLLFGLTFNH